MSALGAVLGLFMAAAAIMTWQSAPTRRRQASVRVAVLLGAASGSTPHARPRPFIPLVDRLFGGRAALEDRLHNAGSVTPPDAFRLRQVVAMALGTGVCALVELAINSVRPIATAPAVLFVAVCAVAGLLLPEWQLDRRIRSRREQMAGQLPHVAELVAFALSAGESPIASLDRVVRTTSGPLTDELGLAVDRVRAGQSIAEALRALSRSCGVRQVQRFVDSLLVAVERGTPLADVMRAQAADARAAAHRDLLVKAGRAEVLMLVPVIFLVLPMVVVIALYPGLANLTSAFN